MAWASAGDGPPLVKTSNWLTHLEYDLESPVWSHWVRFFAEHFRFVRYDERGCGLTDRTVADLSFDRWVEDLETVIDAAGIDEPVALLGMSQGAATALAFAAKYPEKVSRVIIYGGYAQGWRARGDPEGAKFYEAIVEVTSQGWALENPVFRELFTKRFIPNGSEEQIAWFNNLCRKTVTADMAARLLAARADVDITSLLDRVAAPVVLLHPVGDEVVPFAQGRSLASKLADAEFVGLESRNHIVLKHEPAWTRLKEAVLDFMGEALASRDGTLSDMKGLSPRERQILALICEAKSNPEIAGVLGLSERTVRNHASNLFKKLGVKSRAEAILYLYAARRR
ncbi:alpha/beta fold hydrolase [Pelagibius litoralis]|uniref:Alpha/beta fold hydrolase n=1 Tax=Pelagibius litoralis TaxID=374515 RepID=A0A967C5I9_9PROT|nr:alpha/beta fold hydrolase [Pelagibius litoralis]NIA69144.1 alpha/beta fold hydrolase [Pelagibius litoralis]